MYKIHEINNNIELKVKDIKFITDLKFKYNLKKTNDIVWKIEDIINFRKENNNIWLKIKNQELLIEIIDFNACEYIGKLKIDELEFLVKWSINPQETIIDKTYNFGKEILNISNKFFKNNLALEINENTPLLEENKFLKKKN